MERNVNLEDRNAATSQTQEWDGARIKNTLIGISKLANFWTAQWMNCLPGSNQYFSHNWSSTWQAHTFYRHTFVDPCWEYSWEQLYESVVLCRGLLAGAGCLCFAQCLRKLKITSLVSAKQAAGLGLSSLQYLSLSLSRPGQSCPAPNLPTPSLSRDQAVPNLSSMWHSSFIVTHRIVKAV